MKNPKCILPTLMVLGAVLTTAYTVSAALKTWNGTAGDTFCSSGGNWSPAGAPGASDNVTFTNDGVSDNPIALGGSVNIVVDAIFVNSINSLGYMNTNGFHNTSVINPLVVRGTSASDVANIADDGEPAVFFIGSGKLDGKDDSVFATIIGNSLMVSNGNANLSVSQISQTAGLHRATLDLMGLNSFTCVVSNVLVGHNFTQPDFAWRPTGELFLAKTNSITTGFISVSDAYQNAGGNCYIHLGSANTLNTDKIRIGMHKCVGIIDITPGVVNPWVTLRDSAGTGRQFSWELGDEFESNTNLLFGFFTSNQARGTMDLTGATVDALVDRITLGRGQIQRDSTVRNGDGNGTLIFGGGSIDANYIEMGIQVPGPFIGGSVGHGVLNVNNDPGVGPALLTVRSNLVMAVQQPGNTDVNGSTAEIDINGGTLAVAGDIVDGAGLSTINIGSGGKLDLKPAGDATPGNLSVDILNITDGIITNYATLSATNINLLGSLPLFTVYPGQAIAPAGVGVIGTLSVAGDVTLRGSTVMDISKINNTRSADQLAVSGTLDLGGALTVTFFGNNNLVAGDKFTLFNAPTLTNSFTTVKLPPPGSGLGWTNKILIDGSIETVATGEPAVPPTIAVSYSPTSISLSWPTAYTSFALGGQTNPITVGLSNNWAPVTGVAGNQITIPRHSANGCVFFQLFQQ